MRFAYVDLSEEFMLNEMFDIKAVPNVFLHEDGVWHEQYMLHIMYQMVTEFIDNVDRERQLYNSFPTRRPLSDTELWLKQYYNKVHDEWFGTYRASSVEWM